MSHPGLGDKDWVLCLACTLSLSLPLSLTCFDEANCELYCGEARRPGTQGSLQPSILEELNLARDLGRELEANLFTVEP